VEHLGRYKLRHDVHYNSEENDPNRRVQPLAQPSNGQLARDRKEKRRTLCPRLSLAVFDSSDRRHRGLQDESKGHWTALPLDEIPPKTVDGLSAIPRQATPAAIKLIATAISPLARMPGSRVSPSVTAAIPSS
jgi:hypothetical protein